MDDKSSGFELVNFDVLRGRVRGCHRFLLGVWVDPGIGSSRKGVRGRRGLADWGGWSFVLEVTNLLT